MALSAFILGAVFFYSSGFFPYSTATAAAAFMAFNLHNRRFAVLVLLILGFGYSLLRSAGVEPATEGATVNVSGVFVSAPAKTEYGFKQALSVDSITDPATGKRLSIDIDELEAHSDIPFKQAFRYDVSGRFNSGGDMKPIAYYGPSIRITSVVKSGGAVWLESIRAKAERAIRRDFTGDTASLIMSLTTGERAQMSNELRNAFSKTGLAHLLSISGTHFGIFFLVIFWTFGRVLNLLPYETLERITAVVSLKESAALMSMPFMAFYLFLSGSSIPALRSFIMIMLFLIGLFLGRSRRWLNFLVAACFILILWHPWVLYDISFLMSFSSVLFIGIATDWLESKEKRHNFVLTSIAVSLAATLGVGPLIAYYFHGMPVAGLITNIFITPFIGFIVVPVSLLAVFFYLIIGSIPFAGLLGVVTDFSIFLVHGVSALPYGYFTVPGIPIALLLAFYLPVALYLASRKGLLLFLPLLLVLLYAFFASQDRDLTVTFIDQRRGDSAVVELPDGKTLVIDTGLDGKNTASYIKYRGKSSIDAIALSHPHIDHAGGLNYLLDNFKVGEIWHNGLSIDEATVPTNIKMRTLLRGDFIDGQDYRISALHPYKGFYTFFSQGNLEDNNKSLVLKITGNRSFLFPGDIEYEAEEDVSHLGGILKSDVLKLPHHGLLTSYHPDFFHLVSPAHAVVTSNEAAEKITTALTETEFWFMPDIKAVKFIDRKDGLVIRPLSSAIVKKARSWEDEKRNLLILSSVW